MSTPTITPPSSQLEQTLEQTTESAAVVDIAVAPAGPSAPQAEKAVLIRLSVIMSLTVLSAAIMAGGVFIGVIPRIYAAIGGIAGVALGAQATRIRRPGLLYAWVVGGVFLIGVLFVIPNGFGTVFGLGREIRVAVSQGDVLRPPVEFVPGWRAILTWIMAALGFASAWVGIELKRPALGLLVPLPLVGIGAISVPSAQQLPSGLAALVLLAVALGILSGTQLERGEDEQAPNLKYELRRAVRALPLIAVVTVALFFASKSHFLFPKPIYNPAQEAKKPKSIPLSKVKDRVLFTVDAAFTGPWKMGSLDVFDGTDWRLPPFAETTLKEVPKSGIVDKSLKPAVKATFVVQGLGGGVLPSLPDTVGIAAEGPKLAYDGRTGNIRLAQGSIQPGLTYSVYSAGVPQVEKLRQANPAIPDPVKKFLDIPKPPAAVQDLLRQASSDDLWDRLDFLRQKLLHSVTASGQGSPVSVPPSKVQDLLAGSKTGTPFEIVAAQAELARWAGVPSRIGYGFDGGDKVGTSTLEVRPKHGAVYLEVYFTGYGWLPIIGDPLQAKESFSDSPQQFNPAVLSGSDVAVRLFLPQYIQKGSETYAAIRRLIATLLPIIFVLLLVYYLWPLPFKAFRRGRLHGWAMEAGPRARIAAAYAQFRDLAIDYGYRHSTDTPLMFLERVIPDEAHTELAWLVTRALWGDLSGSVDESHALAAEELAASLRRRLGQAHAVTLRVVASLSRLSVRNPYAPDLNALASVGIKKEERRAA